MDELDKPDGAEGTPGADGDDIEVLVRRAGETFVHAAPGALLDAGILRGRQKLARRRVLVAVGGALALALVAGGATYGGELLRADDKASVADTDATRLEVSAAQLAGILNEGLDRTALSLTRRHVEGDDSTGGARPSAKSSASFVDNFGWGRVDLTVRRVAPGSGEAKELLACPEDDEDVDVCLPEADSRVLKLRRTDRGVLEWQVALVTKHGYAVEINEFNVREESAKTRRGLTPFTVGKLRDLARYVGASFGEDGRPIPTRRWEIMASLLPEGLEVRKHSEDGELWVYDPKTRATTYVRVYLIAGGPDIPGEKLPDGATVGAHQVMGEKPGVVLREAEVRRPSGERRRIAAYNAESPKGPATTAEPALSLEQLKAIVANPAWLAERSDPMPLPRGRDGAGAAPSSVIAGVKVDQDTGEVVPLSPDDLPPAGFSSGGAQGPGSGR